MPDRYLVVKPVLGNTYAAVSASTHFSDWTQPADRQVPGEPLRWDDIPTGAGTEQVSEDASTMIPDGPPPDDTYPLDLWGFCTTFMEGFTGLPAIGSGSAELRHAPWGLIPIGMPGDDDNFSYGHGLSGERGGAGEQSVADLNQTRWKDSWRGPWPAGAIGYEVEQASLTPTGEDVGPYSRVLNAHASVTIAPAVTTGEHLGGLVVRVVPTRRWSDTNDESRLHVEYGTGTSAEWRADDAPPRYITDDIEPGVAGGGIDVGLPGTGTADPVVYQWDEDFGEDDYKGLLGIFYAVITQPGAAVQVLAHNDGNGRVNVSPGVFPFTVTYTIRPPRIRWIFPSDPYRRTYPRDDALAGGATRTWPPARSIQSSNRTFGGYL